MGNHISRQDPAQLFSKRSTFFSRVERDQAVLFHNDGSLGDQLHQRCLDLLRFNALSVDFHLPVISPDIYDRAVVIPITDIAGQVHLSRPVWIRNKSLRCARGIPDISDSDRNTGNTDLALDPHRNRLQIPVQNIHPAIIDGVTYRDGVSLCPCAVVVCDIDRTFCRAIKIMNGSRSSADQGSGKCLAGQKDVFQTVRF